MLHASCDSFLLLYTYKFVTVFSSLKLLISLCCTVLIFVPFDVFFAITHMGGSVAALLSEMFIAGLTLPFCFSFFQVRWVLRGEWVLVHIPPAVLETWTEPTHPPSLLHVSRASQDPLVTSSTFPCQCTLATILALSWPCALALAVLFSKVFWTTCWTFCFRTL